MVEKKKVARQKILVIKRLEMSMVNTAQITLTPMNVQLHAPKIPINAQPEQTPITAKNKLLALHAQRTLMMNVALLLQTAQLFANLMKKNAKNQVQMRMDVHYLLLVLFKSVTIMENFALFTVPENVTITKSNVQEKETIPAAKNQTSVFH